MPGTTGRSSKREGENCWSGKSVGSPSRHRNSGCAARDRDSAGPCALRSAEWFGRIHYFDAEKDSRLTFLTNNFLLPALTIAQLYRARWKVELFFRWIKQHLRIKAFYGTSENAVKTQVWVAVSVYVLVAIVKKQLGLDLSLYKILQILSVTVFEKTPILEGFSNFSDEFTDADPCIQLNLFDF